MTRLFGKTSKAIDQTPRFLKRCRFSLDELKPHRYPSEFRKGYATAHEALVALTEAGPDAAIRKASPHPFIRL